MADAAEADELCEAVQQDWPEVYAETGADAITFDIPDEDSDLVCARPAE